MNQRGSSRPIDAVPGFALLFSVSLGRTLDTSQLVRAAQLIGATPFCAVQLAHAQRQRDETEVQAASSWLRAG